MRAVSLVSVGLVVNAAAAYAGPCPATITVDEPMQTAHGEMDLKIAVEHKFRYVSFYEGDPKDQADLAPDDNGPNGKIEQRWELTRTPGRPITMVCRYHGTDRTYVETVPASVKSCRLIGEMDEDGEVVGSPELECR